VHVSCTMGGGCPIASNSGSAFSHSAATDDRENAREGEVSSQSDEKLDRLYTRASVACYLGCKKKRLVGVYSGRA
jgi:hypothetical protein